MDNDLHEHQPPFEADYTSDSSDDSDGSDRTEEQGERERFPTAKLYWTFIKLYKPHLENLAREAAEINTAMHGGGYEGDPAGYHVDIEDALDRCIREMMDTALRAHNEGPGQ